MSQPTSEAQRLAVVRSLALLDTPREERFDRISRVAAALYGVPIAFVSLLDEDRQWIKSCVGIPAGDIPRAQSICAVTIQGIHPLVIPDLQADDRFRHLDAVAGPPGMRAYAGHPLLVRGAAVGTLCVSDTVPREFAPPELELLADLAAWAERELDAVELAESLEQERRSRVRLAGVLDASPDAVLVVDDGWDVTEANAGSAEVFGKAQGALLGLNLSDLLARRDGATLLPVSDGRYDALRPAGPLATEVRVRRLDLPGGAAVVDVRDVSRQDAAEQALVLLQRRFDLILSAAETGIVGTDERGRISVVNPAAARMLAAERSLEGLDLHDALHQGFESPLHDRADCPVLRALDDRVTVRVPQGVQHRLDGVRIEVEYAVAPVLVEGHVMGAVVTINDISTRRAVERMKDEFVSVVSHELRTPLTSIRGSLGLLGSDRFGTLEPRAARLVEIATGSTDRLVRLVNDILDLERIESGKVETDLRTQSLRPLLLAARDAAVVGGSRDTVEVRVLEGDADAAVDADLLIQAVTNLLANAIKFSPVGARVDVGVVVDGREVVVAVADHGRGIPADQLARVFERFEQVDATDARDKGGTGLGLAITRSIASRLGGRVEVTSELGAGSTFSLVLPGTGGAAPNTGVGVVLVEDDPDLSEVLEQALRDEGVGVATASTEDEAVELVTRLRPWLLVLDIELAQGSGYGVVARLRRHPEYAGLHVVVATVHDLDDASLNRLRLGPTRLVQKGRGDQDLVRVVLDAVSTSP